MAQRLTTKAYYCELFRTIQPLPRWVDKIERAADMVATGKPSYERVQEATGVPWYFIGLVHLMESHCNFSRQILNGEKWKGTRRKDKKTTIVPKGRGPWPDWITAGIEAMTGRDYITGERYEYDFTRIKDWSIGRMLYYLERFNGMGYADPHGVNSPYLYSGCQHGKNVGKYVGDGKYSASAVSRQVGAAVVLRQLCIDGVCDVGEPFRKSTGTVLDAPPKVFPLTYDRRGERLCGATFRDQRQLNEKILEDDLRAPDGEQLALLVVDGWLGQKSSEAHFAAYGEYLINDRRRAQ